MQKNSSSSRMGRLARVAMPLLVLTLVTTVAGRAAAAAPPELIVLPGAVSAEGIAAGRGNTFFAGDLVRGDIFRGNIRRGTAEMFIDVPDGRMAVGMAVNVAHDLLFVAGGPGRAYVYDTNTGAEVATYPLGDPAVSTINDVALTPDGAWFTDSAQAKLYFVPVSPAGDPGEFRELAVTGPAADIVGAFNLNGIQAVAGSDTLIVAHSGTDLLYTVNSVTGASAVIAGVAVPNVDGIVLQGQRLWAVLQNTSEVSVIRLSPGFDSGVVVKTLTSDLLQYPSTAARFGNRLAVINAKFDTGFPPTADQYEVIVVPA